MEHIGKEAFDRPEATEIRWLSGGAAMINARGTVIMIDPVFEGFDMPLTYDPPLKPEEVKRIDGLLVTHIDNDHFSRDTIRDVKNVTEEYHTTQYVAEVMREELQIPGQGHDIGDEFDVGNIHVRLTPAWHNWQNEHKKWQYREWKKEDYCGFYMTTPDGTVWMAHYVRRCGKAVQCLSQCRIDTDSLGQRGRAGLVYFQRRSAGAEKSNRKSGQIACACAGRGVHIE